MSVYTKYDYYCVKKKEKKNEQGLTEANNSLESYRKSRLVESCVRKNNLKITI